MSPSKRIACLTNPHKIEIFMRYATIFFNAVVVSYSQK